MCTSDKWKTWIGAVDIFLAGCIRFPASWVVLFSETWEGLSPYVQLSASFYFLRSHLLQWGQSLWRGDISIAIITWFDFSQWDSFPKGGLCSGAVHGTNLLVICLSLPARQLFWVGYSSERRRCDMACWNPEITLTYSHRKSRVSRRGLYDLI